MPGVTGGGVAPVRGGAWWPERDTVPAENCAFVPPMTLSRAMVRLNRNGCSKKVQENRSAPEQEHRCLGGPRGGGACGKAEILKAESGKGKAEV